MQRHFDDELDGVKADILKMGQLVENEILGSVEALKHLDPDEALQVVANDKQIDDLELKIEEKSLDLLARQQPMAADLRFICMAMKIITELERMSDLAVDIAQRVMELADKPLLKPLIDIPKLTVIAQQMTKDVIGAFVDKDADKASAVILMDSKADNLRNLIQKELIDDYMSKDPTTATRAVPLLLVSRHLERICDHATNIAEDIIYMCSAKVVKHHPEKI